MTFEKTPYFMTNPDWFYFDEDAWKYKLTSKAPDKARDSYKEFYAELEKQHGASDQH